MRAVAAAPAPPRTAPARPLDAAVRGTPWWLALLWGLCATLTLMLLVTSGVAVTTVAVFVAGPLYLLGAMLVGRLARDERRLCLHLFTGAFLARYAAAVFVVCVMAWAGVTQLEGGRDYLTYDAQGWYLAENWRAGNATFVVTDKDPGYFFVVAAVYTIVGHFPLGPTLLNAFVGGLTAVMVFLIGRDTFDRRAGVIGGFLAAFLPTLVFWSSLLYKDTLLAFAITWGWLLASRMIRRRQRSAALYLAFPFIPLFLMRPESAVTLGAALIALVVWEGRANLGGPVWIGLAAFALIGLLFALEAVGMGGKIAVLDRFMNPLTAVIEHREMWADRVARERAEGFSQALYGRNLLRSPHLLVFATVLPFVSPLPGSGNVGMNFYTFLFPGHLLWLALLPCLVYGAVWSLRHPSGERILLLGFVAATAVGVALAGYFSNPRYLVQVVPLLLLFCAVGLRDFRRWWLLYGSVCAAAVGVLCLYGLAKGG